MKCFNVNDLKYFPEYNWFEKAINYPYDSPENSYTFKNGKFYNGIHTSLKKRIPIISIGSNRSPYQLKNKFGLQQDLCVTPAKLYNSEIVYAASISVYGSIPATQWPKEGSDADLNLLWLTEEQLNIMHLSEGVGIAYDFVELDKSSVVLKEVDYSGPIFGYVSTKGIYTFEGDFPLRLKKIRSNKNTFLSIDEYEALTKLNFQETKGKIGLEKWLKELISHKTKRLKLIKKMLNKSILPKHKYWKVIKINVNGTNIF